MIKRRGGVHLGSAFCVYRTNKGGTAKSDQCVEPVHGNNTHMYAALKASREHRDDLVPYSDLCPRLPLRPPFLTPPFPSYSAFLSNIL